MVKNRRKIRFIKTNVCIHSFERHIDSSGKYIFIECPDDTDGYFFMKIEYICPKFQAA